MTTLLIGFDSAWTPTNSGALVGVLELVDGTFHELGPPQIVDYHEAEALILKWQAEHLPTATIVLLDQPTIVKNAAGQRPVGSRGRGFSGSTAVSCSWTAPWMQGAVPSRITARSSRSGSSSSSLDMIALRSCAIVRKTSGDAIGTNFGT